MLYAAAFRRLAGVTQVVGAVEGHIFHNRLTHTLKVAQIARRLAEIWTSDPLANRLGGLHPDVAEAAALAHDLGHPPFGHVAETQLNKLVRAKGDREGFEGNAQSFRIVSRLEAHRPEYDGLNLTRATLNALLKYPTYRDKLEGSADQFEKFGAYRSDSEAFDFARKGFPHGKLSLEAEVMDVADSIAYSVHDLADFHRAGLIPISYLAQDEYAFRQLIATWGESSKRPPEELDRHVDSLKELLRMYTPNGADERADDPWERQCNLQFVSSFLIDRFIRSYKLVESDPTGRHIIATPAITVQMRFLQRLVWHFVIDDPRLATQQYGQREIIETLFNVFVEAVEHENMRMIPPLLQHEVRKARKDEATGSAYITPSRVAADIVSSFTDVQAALLFRRLTGSNIGSVADLIVS